LAGKPRDQLGLSLGDQRGEFLGLGGQAALAMRVPNPRSAGHLAHGRRDVGGRKMVGEARATSLLVDLEVAQHIVGVGQ